MKYFLSSYLIRVTDASCYCIMTDREIFNQNDERVARAEAAAVPAMTSINQNQLMKVTASFFSAKSCPILSKLLES